MARGTARSARPLTIAELSERLGHASTQMTLDRYVHVEPGVDKRNASARMFDDEQAVTTIRQRGA